MHDQTRSSQISNSHSSSEMINELLRILEQSLHLFSMSVAIQIQNVAVASVLNTKAAESPAYSKAMDDEVNKLIAQSLLQARKSCVAPSPEERIGDQPENHDKHP